MPIKTATAYVARGNCRTSDRTAFVIGSVPLRRASDSCSIKRNATSEAAVAISDRIASGVNVTV